MGTQVSLSNNVIEKLNIIRKWKKGGKRESYSSCIERLWKQSKSKEDLIWSEWEEVRERLALAGGINSHCNLGMMSLLVSDILRFELSQKYAEIMHPLTLPFFELSWLKAFRTDRRNHAGIQKRL